MSFQHTISRPCSLEVLYSSTRAQRPVLVLYPQDSSFRTLPCYGVYLRRSVPDTEAVIGVYAGTIAKPTSPTRRPFHQPASSSHLATSAFRRSRSPSPAPLTSESSLIATNVKAREDAERIPSRDIDATAAREMMPRMSTSDKNSALRQWPLPIL